MARNTQRIRSRRDEVWQVVATPATYPEWLAGARAIRRVEPEWPARGSRFHHVLGLGPFEIRDNSEVLEVVAPRLLKLRVRARPFGRATATFMLDEDGEETVVTLHEECEWPPGAIARRLADPLVHLRNSASLRRMARLIEGGPEPAVVPLPGEPPGPRRRPA